jgi:putative transposase
VLTPAGKRKAVAHLVDPMSEQRACKAIGCCRMTVRYKATRADYADLRQRIRAIAEVRRRFGYRRLHVLLKREGYLVNHKKLFPTLPGREAPGAPRKRAMGTRAPMMVPMPNDRWSLDFVSGSTHRRPTLPYPHLALGDPGDSGTRSADHRGSRARAPRP